MITGINLLNECADRLGWSQIDTLAGTPTSETRKLLRLLNRVLYSMQTLDDWPLLRESADLQLVAAVDTSEYFDLTNGSKTVSLGTSAVPTITFTDSYKNRAIQLGTDPTLYRITRVVSESSIELNRPWVGTTYTDEELTAKIVQDRYSLPKNFDRPTDGWENFFGNPNISPVGPNEFLAIRRSRGSSMLIGDPERFTIYGLDDSEAFQTLHFDIYPENDRVLNYTYQKNHPEIETDEDRVLFSKSHEGVVIEAVLYLANRDYQDDAKMQLVLQDYIRSLNASQASGNVAQDRMQIKQSNWHRQQQARNFRRMGRRVDWGTLFDQANRVGFY